MMVYCHKIIFLELMWAGDAFTIAGAHRGDRAKMSFILLGKLDIHVLFLPKFHVSICMIAASEHQ